MKIRTEDGIELHGWMIFSENRGKLPTIVFFHENAGNIGARIEYFKYYQLLVHVNILVVSYRGYGDS